MRDNIVSFEEKKELSDKEMVEAVLGDSMAVLQAEEISHKGKPITVKELQEIVLVDVYTLCDLLKIGSPELGK